MPRNAGPVEIRSATRGRARLSAAVYEFARRVSAEGAAKAVPVSGPVFLPDPGTVPVPPEEAASLLGN